MQEVELAKKPSVAKKATWGIAVVGCIYYGARLMSAYHGTDPLTSTLAAVVIVSFYFLGHTDDDAPVPRSKQE